MTRSVPRRRRSEAGAVLVEAAIIFPLVFVLISAVIDLGFWAYQNAQVANAARDGARVAVLDYATTVAPQYADTGGPNGNGTFSSTDVLVPGSADQLIESAIAAHLAGRAFTATVVCYTAGSTTVTSCSSAAPGTDEITVTVTTARPSYSFIGPRFGSSSITESSTVVIVGLPQAISAATTTTSTSSTTTTSTSTTTTTICPTPSISTPNSSQPFTLTHNNTGTLTITGRGFQSGLTVASAGFSSVTVTNVTGSSITATVKAVNGQSNAGLYNLAVTNSCGSTTTSNNAVDIT
jgi:Flp pilus assembly protein TadG